MALLVNLRHLEKDSVRLEGQLEPSELDVEELDELIHVNRPVNYALEVLKLDKSLLAQGRLELTLDCECARCLKHFEHRIELARWARHIPLEGEESAVVANDCVDLTPYVREDILLEFPQHPLCQSECGGLPRSAPGRKKGTGGTGQTKENSSAWAELNKLKFK
jgi:uncharacterized protein